jgi:hypothetical protein
VWDVTAKQPPPTSRAEIAALARQLQAILWIVHVVVNPVVDVDGDSATGEFKASCGCDGGTGPRWYGRWACTG